MAPIASDFAILPIQMPPTAAYPHAAAHELRLKAHTPKIPGPTDERSLFLKNLPVDASTAHVRALFSFLVGAGRFESVAFDDEDARALPGVEPAQAALVATLLRKRKRDEVDETQESERAARLPPIWTRTLRRSGGTAVVLLADARSVRLVLKAVAKLHKTKKYPVWGEGLPANTPGLGAPWITAHLRAARADKTATQAAVHAFFTAFNRREKEAAEAAKRLRSEPDEDGFVTVVRGGREAPASKAVAEEARRKMVERETRKKDELADFYRFQLRERRKKEQAEMVRRFQADREKVEAMREKRTKFQPET